MTSADMRLAVLSAARRLFEQEGVEALSVRRVAAAAGCTTMALYTHFDGKDGLLAALFDEGFEQLAAAQRAVPITTDALAYVDALCQAYRETARRFPHHYALMLGRFSGTHQPSAASAMRALATLDVLASAIAATRPDAPHRERASRASAHTIFAFCHGWVSLEALQFPVPDQDPDARFTSAVRALVQQGMAAG